MGGRGDGRGVQSTGEQDAYGYVAAQADPYGIQQGLTQLFRPIEEGLTEDRTSDRFGRMGAVLEDAGIAAVHWVSPVVRSAGAHMEVVGAAEIGSIRAEVAEGLAIEDDPDLWIPADVPDQNDFVHRSTHRLYSSEMDALLRWAKDQGRGPGHPGSAKQWGARMVREDCVPKVSSRSDN